MAKKNIKYLVTGGCGFIGSCLIRELLKHEGNFVINIDKMTYASNPEALGNVSKDSYQFYKGNISDRALVRNILIDHEPDYIIHLAAESHVDRSIDDASSFIDTNVVGTFSLLEESRVYWNKLGKEKQSSFRFLLVSTDEVYGSIDSLSFTENSPLKANSPYAASKASADLLARAWFKTYKFPILITNSSNNYGKWQYPEKLIPLVIRKCLEEKSIPIYGKGNQIRDWIFVEDNIHAILLVLKNGDIGEKYNIGGAKEKTNISIVEEICSIIDEIHPRKKGSYSELITYVEDRPGHDFRYSIDSSKIQNKLDWKPKKDFSEGLYETINWYIENKEKLFDYKKISYDGDRLGKINK